MSGDFDIIETNNTEKYGPPISHNQQLVITIVFALMSFWSTMTNCLTIMAIASQGYMRSKSNIFIMSLACSDLLSGLIATPLWIYRRFWGFSKWVLGDFVCKLYWGTEETTSYCTAMHVAAFSIWRYLGVKYPHKVLVFKRGKIQLLVASLWLIAIIFGGFTFGSMFAVIDKSTSDSIVANWPHCSLNFKNNRIHMFQIYYPFSSSTFILFPICIVFITSFLIGYELIFQSKFKNDKRRIKEKRAVAQLALIVLSFLFGYIVYITNVLWTIRTTNKDPLLDFWWHVIALLLIRLSECLNPIIYNISSKKMRQASLDVLRKMFRPCTRSRNNALGTIKMSSTFSNMSSEKTKHITIAPGVQIVEEL